MFERAEDSNAEDVRAIKVSGEPTVDIEPVHGCIFR
jgi:hypothetical protein